LVSTSANITNVYRNARVANGVMGVSSAEFGRTAGRFTAVNAELVRTTLWGAIRTFP
jgi:hypothetical protein